MDILIVDDDCLICQSLQLLLDKEEDITVVGVVENGREAISFCEKIQPDLILMDIQMPVLNGIESTKMIKRNWPHIKIMMLTTFQDKMNIRLALKAGAEGYIIKSSAIKDMAKQIRAIESNSMVLTPEVLDKLVHQNQSAEFLELTEREKDVMELVVEGLSNKEIAKQLYLSEGTVRNVLSIVLDKLELRDRTQLAIYYWQRQK
ncbi:MULTISPECIES: response regulator transcription factor [Cytobacillus]|uniref:Response regulator transcription factor n=1 Tax=Cytobacillus stercorigallinarum TaxID=2762240 RepID=A0ABR8QRB6_9BACI|nr:response regulator transcription factor [Cytobacillus stercorigallinarum]MBD7937964.1 response regulator transcription factor [Cytobacillus stercorigallinarum]